METNKVGEVRSIRELKPGWVSRVFGIETATLVACDAHWTGTNWARHDSFTFLYRSKRGKFFVLHDARRWSVIRAEEARKRYDALPEKLVDRETAFAVEAQLETLAGKDDDDDQFKVLCNAAWEFSIWPDDRKVPAGWWHIGITGRRSVVLDFVRRNCVFGAPNPDMLPIPAEVRAP